MGMNIAKPRISMALVSANFVFLRREAKESLDTPYVGPYKVLLRTEKYFTLQVDVQIDKVSVD